MTSRTAERQGLDVPTRFLLIERDLDEFDETLARIDERTGKMVGLMVGLLVSISTACILLAINLVVNP